MAIVSTLVKAVVLSSSLGLAYVVFSVLYNLFLHPLRSYPGPVLARASILVYSKKGLRGSLINWIHELHQKYGPVVRYAPNELSFIDPGIWKDVYGHRATDFTKQYAFYGSDPFGHPPGLIRSDNIAHARQRKLVSHAFSDKALRDQEQILKGYARLLISKLKETVARDGKADLVNWYNFTTFDIMADLTFGEPLKLLQDSEYSPWVKSLIDNIKMIMFMNIVRRWQLLDSLLQRFIPAKLKQQRKVHMEHSIDRVDKRLARTTDRPDIWTYVMRHSESEETKGKGLLETEMYSNAALFMLAGTETTATELSGLTYNLLKNPTKLARLQNEIRSAFSSLDDIHMNNLAQLEYLNACVEEGLRIYPPVPVGLPRTTPKGGARVNGHWVPGGTTVTIPQYAAYHSPSNFKDPDDFVPERWLPEGQQKYGSDRREVLNPFSFGPRNCLGKNLAYHEMRLVLASVILNFDMHWCEEAEGWTNQASYLLWHKPPLNVKLTPVN